MWTYTITEFMNLWGSRISYVICKQTNKHLMPPQMQKSSVGGDESGVAISQIPDFWGLYSLIPDFLGVYSLIPDFWGLYSLIPDFRPLYPVPTFSRPIIMFYIFHMIEKIYINAYPPPSHISIVVNENIICQNFTAIYCKKVDCSWY